MTEKKLNTILKPYGFTTDDIIPNALMEDLDLLDVKVTIGGVPCYYAADEQWFEEI